MSIKIALLDDHQIVVDGLKLLLKGQTNMQVILENTNGWLLLEDLKENKVDILLTDIMMPSIDGYEMAMMMKTHFPTVKIIALSMNGEGELIEKMINQAEVLGYLLKTANKTELIRAIELVAEGEAYYSKEIIEELHTYNKLKRQNQQYHLTAREHEIVKCIAQDLTNKQIADKLFISERTVETHRKNIFRKVNVHSVVGLLEFAKKQKMI